MSVLFNAGQVIIAWTTRFDFAGPGVPTQEILPIQFDSKDGLDGFLFRDTIRCGTEHDWFGITAVTKLTTHRFAREQIEKEPPSVCRGHRFISKGASSLRP